MLKIVISTFLLSVHILRDAIVFFVLFLHMSVLRLLVYYSAISIDWDVNLLRSLSFEISHHQSGKL